MPQGDGIILYLRFLILYQDFLHVLKITRDLKISDMYDWALRRDLTAAEREMWFMLTLN